jgi:hypothetical protein
VQYKTKPEKGRGSWNWAAHKQLLIFLIFFFENKLKKILFAHRLFVSHSYLPCRKMPMDEMSASRPLFNGQRIWSEIFFVSIRIFTSLAVSHHQATTEQHEEECSEQANEHD